MKNVFLGPTPDYILPFRDKRASLILQLNTWHSISLVTDMSSADLSVFILDSREVSPNEFVAKSRKTNNPALFFTHATTSIPDEFIWHIENLGIVLYRYWVLSDISEQIVGYLEHLFTEDLKVKAPTVRAPSFVHFFYFLRT